MNNQTKRRYSSWHFRARMKSPTRTPIIRQDARNECGLACLAMVLGHHGQHVPLRELRDLSGISSRGATLNDLLQVARNRGLLCRPLRLELDEIHQLNTPCILHWRMDHFVVLLGVSATHAIINDPAAGRVHVTLQQVSQAFTGVALELAPSEQFVESPKQPEIRFRTLFSLLKGFAPSLWSILGFSLALEVLALLLPQLVQVIVDQVLANGDHELLTLLGASFILLILISSAVSACRSWSVAWLRARGGMRWTSSLVDRLLRLRQDYFERRHVGDVVSRVDAVHAIQTTVTGQLITALMDGLVSSLTLIMLLVYSPMLASIVASGTLLYVALRLSIYRRFEQANIEKIEAAADQRTDLIECLRGMSTIRLNNKAGVRSSLQANKTARFHTCEFRCDKLALLFDGAGSALRGVQRVVVLWLGASLAISGHMTAGALMAFSAYADQFSSRFSSLVDYIVQLRLLKTHSERVADIALAPEEPNTRGCYQGPVPPPSVCFKNVSYRHSDTSPWIMRNASLTVEPGECIALVGASGSGKTTALRLLLGLIDPCEGSILFGGISLSSLGKSAVRDRIGVVLQDDHLFSGTIADNISFFDTAPRMEDVYTAASIAKIHEEICAMPMGYRTSVGDMGSGLSGGQKQRIILARAIYRKPSLLILDEATSHLDIVTESEVSTQLKRLSMTRITVAHRTETIRAADRVLTLVDGQFLELESPA
ncbi:ATP-binding cassette, subfamily B, RaxB [Luteibacter sp. 329MFSha]|nr:ATP-binding cassette, subfamily B, RaxB [Luteibacter sp. 329MFSha]